MVITEKKIKNCINHFLKSLFEADEEVYYNFHTNFLSIVKNEKCYWTLEFSYKSVQNLISHDYKNIYDLLFNLIIFALNDNKFIDDGLKIRNSQFNLINKIFRFSKIEEEYQLDMSLVNKIFTESFRRIIGDLSYGYILKIRNKKDVFQIKLKKIKI